MLVCLAAALALHALLAIIWCILRALWRGLDGPAWARSRLAARQIARATREYDEAA
ncbi:hypothetical protein AB0I06_34295 [Streptomyces sp. NPDC050674]|uniref:hypothetical protein n=1 Tax=Streptomyces sp. NPDC050674 TaxID=3157216 RepID=UPI003433A714